MHLNGKRVLVCDCEGTMNLDGKSLARACGADQRPEVQTHLCRSQLDNFRSAVRANENLIVACTQESPLFREVAEELGSDITITYTNIREHAGWSEQAGQTLAKTAALLAMAAADEPPIPSVTMKSEGTCLVYGRDETAIEAARQLAGRVDATVLLSTPEMVIPPRIANMPVFKGSIVQAKGHLGAFEVVVDDYAPVRVSSRQALEFGPPNSGATSRCDIILDLTGEAPLFAGPEKRDGYLRPDPANPVAVQRALLEISDLNGEFEKPRYIKFDGAICTHSRSGKPGCTRCLDACPASAISPAGEAVQIDPYICGGCGNCAAVCPTGAASYAVPPLATQLERLRTLLTTYHRVGGKNAVVLVHDTEHGEDMLGLMARFGRGLPANVLPFPVNSITQIGFEFLASALAYGARRMVLLVPPQRRGELDGLAAQVGLAEALTDGLGFGGGRVELLEESDPEALERLLYEATKPIGPIAGDFLPMGTKRGVTRLALEHLHTVAPNPVELLRLPPGAPFGALKVDAAGCTLCLACVGACPTGALIDNPESPQLRFQELGCVQCGLCRATCPENVIQMDPRMNFTEAVRRDTVLKEEEPFECVRCGKPFGTKSSIERIVDKLAGNHPMFMDERSVARMKMCEDCRVIVQLEEPANPMATDDRPITRTTDDYLKEREALKQAYKAQNESSAEEKDSEGD